MFDISFLIPGFADQRDGQIHIPDARSQPALSRSEKNVPNLAFAVVVLRGDCGEEGILAEGGDRELETLEPALGTRSDRAASQSKICWTSWRARNKIVRE